MRGIDNFANYLKLLAPPARGAVSEAALRGERVFADVGCTGCHRPQMQTGPSSNPLFDRKPVHLFSDLLLHDIGTGDGIEQADAKDNEVRTPALWGLRFRRPLLHEAAASTPEQAILMHGGEAEACHRGAIVNCLQSKSVNCWTSFEEPVGRVSGEGISAN